MTPEGFEAVAGEITAADGEVCAVCLWAAATPEQRGRGLMAVTDMGGADGMVFLFGEPTTSAFWMRDTPMPLSIAFFDAAGAFVSAADMAPCLDGAPEDCAALPGRRPVHLGHRGSPGRTRRAADRSRQPVRPAGHALRAGTLTHGATAPGGGGVWARHARIGLDRHR